MTKELGPLPAPKGEGKDGPKEINYDNDHIALDPIPPRIAPQPEITYFYNKATKYLNGSKVEFNTTPGHEYINIQHGNDKTRLTFFENGDVEIIQVDGNRHDEVSKDYDIVVGEDYSKKVEGFNFERQYIYANQSEKRTTFRASEFEVLSNKVVMRASRGIELIGDVIIRGNVRIDGNLQVNGGFNARYQIALNPDYLEKVEGENDPNDEEDPFFYDQFFVKELGDVQGPNLPTQGPVTTGTTVSGPAGSTATSSAVTSSSGTSGGPTE